MIEPHLLILNLGKLLTRTCQENLMEVVGHDCKRPSHIIICMLTIFPHDGLQVAFE